MHLADTSLFFSDHIYPGGKIVEYTKELWCHSKMLPEKLATCMSHKPCHTGDVRSSESESDFFSEKDDDDD
jgi:hypothetical protein